MAKLKRPKDQTDSQVIEQEKDNQDYLAWKTFYKMSTSKDVKEQYDTLRKVLSDYSDARIARQSSCYWYASNDNDPQSAVSAANVGGDWDRRWDLQEKLWLGWYQQPSADDYQSNMKSSMTTGRVETTLNKVKKLNLLWDAKPRHKDDIGKAKIYTELLNTWFGKDNVRKALFTIVKDALIHGSAFFRVYWLDKTGEFSFPQTDPTNLSTEDKEQKLKDLEAGNSTPTEWKDPELKSIYSDIVISPKPIQSIFVDPMARCMHGEEYEARYVIERRIVSLADFHNEFDNDPNAINVDKVKPGAEYKNAKLSYQFFKPPTEIIGKNQVEIIEYENRIDDVYCVLANDMLVKKIPLPYLHKELTYHKIDCIEFMHQFYMVGLPDRLEGSQAVEEIMVNLALQKGIESMNTQLLMDSSIYGESTQAMLRANSRFIPVNTSASMNPGIADKIYPMPYNQVGMDVFKLFDVIERNATISSGIDPNQAALMPDNTAATFGVINKEQVELMLSSLIDNFVNSGLLNAGRQITAVMRQKYSVPRVKEAADDEKPEETWKHIRLQGQKIVVDENDPNKVSIEEDQGVEYDFFEVKGEYLDTREELEVTIRPDSLEVISKGLEMQKSQEAIAQLLPFSVDPDRPETFQQVPLPLFNAPKIASWYARTNNLPEDILLKQENYTQKEVQEAIDETNQMLQEKRITGIPGRCEEHKLIHASALQLINGQIDTLQHEVMQYIQSQPPKMDPMGQPQPPQIPPAQKSQMLKLADIVELLQKHLEQDSQTLDQAVNNPTMPRFSPTQPTLPPPPNQAMGGMPPQGGPPMQGPPLPMGSNVPVPTMDGQAPMPRTNSNTLVGASGGQAIS